VGIYIANKITSADAGIPLLLHAGRARPRAAEFNRSAK
jgi:hypothetical protein